MITKLKQINDDGWIISMVICIIFSIVILFHIKLLIASIIGVIIGILYEHIVEWFAHGWFQHYNCEVFNFFNWRHQRHHDNSEQHHALQPIIILFPVIFLILLPFIIVALFISNLWLKSFSLGVMFGFFVAHIYLNLLHYDIHARKKIFPKFFRNTSYYQMIYKSHIDHHIEHKTGIKKTKYRIYSISNPWLDIIFDVIGLAKTMDIVYLKIILTIDKVYLKWTSN